MVFSSNQQLHTHDTGSVSHHLNLMHELEAKTVSYSHAARKKAIRFLNSKSFNDKSEPHLKQWLNCNFIALKSETLDQENYHIGLKTSLLFYPNH